MQSDLSFITLSDCLPMGLNLFLFFYIDFLELEFWHIVKIISDDMKSIPEQVGALSICANSIFACNLIKIDDWMEKYLWPAAVLFKFNFLLYVQYNMKLNAIEMNTIESMVFRAFIAFDAFLP